MEDKSNITVKQLINLLKETLMQLEILPQDLDVLWSNEIKPWRFEQEGSPIKMYVDATDEGGLYLFWGAETNLYEEPRLLIRPTEFETIFKGIDDA